MHKIFVFTISLFRASTCFEHVFIIRRSKLHYTTSGTITSIGGRLVLSQSVHETATYRCDDTRGCVMQFWPPDDEHMCSKHVVAWNKIIVETKILCIKLVNYWDKNTFCIIHVVSFGSLGVAWWPLVPKFAGSNPAEAVGFLGQKNPQHALLQRGSKAVGPMS